MEHNLFSLNTLKAVGLGLGSMVAMKAAKGLFLLSTFEGLVKLHNWSAEAHIESGEFFRVVALGGIAVGLKKLGEYGDDLACSMLPE